jgi:hypothetical protein
MLREKSAADWVTRFHAVIRPIFWRLIDAAE